MVESPGTNSQSTKRRSLSDLLFWLALLPVILGSLICFGQLALLVNVRNLPANTASLLEVDYLPWKYDFIPAINIPALIEDIARDERASGMVATPAPTVEGTYWVIPTATDEISADETEPPVIFPPTATDEPPEPSTPLPTATRNITATRRPTSTATLRPSATLAPTRTATRTFAPLLPTSTATNQKPDPTRTSTRTPTKTPRPSNTPTPTFTKTKPVEPTNTPVTPTATEEVEPTEIPTPVVVPTYAPVIPLAENEGASEVVEGGCRAYFGYRNENPQEVDIPLGPRNVLSVDTIDISPSQTTHFVVGRINGSFGVTWDVEGPIIWTLDGRTAVANWCNPPAP